MYTGVRYENNGERLRQVQCIAYTDDGVNFTKYNNNPVIAENELPKDYTVYDFRDPKIFKRGEYYYCLIGARKVGGKGRILAFKSRNITDWEFCRDLFGADPEFGDMTECPDTLF